MLHRACDRKITWPGARLAAPNEVLPHEIRKTQEIRHLQSSRREDGFLSLVFFRINLSLDRYRTLAANHLTIEMAQNLQPGQNNDKSVA